MPHSEFRSTRCALYAIAALHSTTVGTLIDFANNVPTADVAVTAASIGLALLRDYWHPSRRASNRRHLVILGALLTRLAFEEEDIPRDRDALI